jgi:hypothetical protein
MEPVPAVSVYSPQPEKRASIAVVSVAPAATVYAVEALPFTTATVASDLPAALNSTVPPDTAPASPEMLADNMIVRAAMLYGRIID